ncbi:MAG TPA: hypothetical protein VMD77_08730 [Candidatus Baltobacteraceae bacterium]|nr:hypothetical protein [Candidatus Baltobacteraceae bacterium]
MSTVENEMKLAEGVVIEIKKVINPLKYSDDEWSTTNVAFIDQAFEHHAAITLLIRSKLFGSAFALLRSVVEIVVRGVWIATCATDGEVKHFRDKGEIGHSFGEMAKAVDKTCGIEFFYDLKKRTWDSLNSYTHTGILQLGRRFTGDKLQPSYKDEEKIEVIRMGTTMLPMIVRPFLARHGHNNEAAEIDQIGKRWVEACKKA